MPYHTDLALVFQAFGGRQKEFNWLVPNFQGHAVGESWGTSLPTSVFGDEPELVSGQVLSQIVEQTDIQFVWGFLFGFAPEVVISPGDFAWEPSADGNRMFWGDKVAPEHPKATVEIVCFDSTLTLLLSKDDDLSRRFRAFFPEAVDLDAHNREREQRGRQSAGAAQPIPSR